MAQKVNVSRPSRCIFKRGDFVVIKIGSSLLIDRENLHAYAEQISHLIRGGVSVILVSSGACAWGAEIAQAEIGEMKVDDVFKRQIQSFYGQPRLMAEYIEAFEEFGLKAGQFLPTRLNLTNGASKESLVRLLEFSILNAPTTVPIINENDVVAVEELLPVEVGNNVSDHIGDNDILGAMACLAMSEFGIKPAAYIMLTSSKGFTIGDPRDPASELIADIYAEDEFPKFDPSIKTSLGAKGGIVNKSKASKMVANAGIPCIIADGREEGILPRLVLSNENAGTYIHPFI